MELTFNTKMPTEKLLGGKVLVESVSDRVFELLGASADMEPEWRRNDAGGYEHYDYGGEKCYVPWLYVRDDTGELRTFSLNGDFKNVPHPDPMPQEWGTPGKKFRLKKNRDIVWL